MTAIDYDLGFLRRIAATPADAAPRLVYADWLDEHDQPEQAAIFRGSAAALASPPGPDSWRRVWRDGFVPSLSPAGLLALRQAILEDDPRLVQGSTTAPPPFTAVLDWPVEAGDALVFAAWRGGEMTVGEAEEHFARYCFECDQRLGEAAECRVFFEFWDNEPRNALLAAMLPEVEWAVVEALVRSRHATD